jgi:thiol-disulfide isomerase/thioredoxin
MKLVYGLFLLTFMIFSCNDNSRKKDINNKATTDIGKINLTTLSDAPVDLDQLKGKVVFINFWATWCKPCIAEMPSIKNAMDSLKNEKIEFLFATDESVKEIESFEANHKFGFNYLKTPGFEELNIMGLPTTFIFDKNGKQVFSEMGYRKWDDKANLDLLLKIANQQ